MKTYLELGDIELMERATTCLRDQLLIRLLFRLGCRVSEALAITIGDIDFEHATIAILHLKKRIRLSCPNCKARLGKRHQYCPECGEEVTQAMKLDDSGDALRLLQEHLGHASFNTTAKYRKVAGKEHRRWYNHLWVGMA